jgi:hypothetical protein
MHGKRGFVRGVLVAGDPRNLEVIGLGLPGSPQVYRFFMGSLSKLYVE